MHEREKREEAELEECADSALLQRARAPQQQPPNDWDNIWGVEYLNWLMAEGAGG